MRALAWFLIAWLSIAPAFADSSFVAPTTVGTASPGQIPGTTTNDNAAAGDIGEVIASIGQIANGTVTISNASPAVITDAATCTLLQTTGCIGIGQVINLTTTGSLPSGLSISTNYYVLSASFVPGVSYEVATTPFGTPINTTTNGSGVHTRVNQTIGCASGNPCTVAAVQLTAGDWRCTGSTEVTTSGITTIARSFIGTTNNSATGAIQQTFVFDMLAIAGLDVTRNTGTVRILQSGTATYYLEAGATFSTGSSASAGSLLCWRAR